MRPHITIDRDLFISFSHDEYMRERSPRHSSQHTPSEPISDDNGFDDENLEHLALSAMSLGMDNDELLFNMFYFGGDDAVSGFRGSLNTAIEETVAAHSTGNT